MHVAVVHAAVVHVADPVCCSMRHSVTCLVGDPVAGNGHPDLGMMHMGLHAAGCHGI